MSDLQRLQQLDREGSVNSPEALELAVRAYNVSLPLHQCYWNDRFYIAVRFGLQRELQRRAVVNSVVLNGASGYFETETHFGFDNSRLLQELGISAEHIPTGKGYHTLDEKVIRAVAQKFEVDLDDPSEMLRLQEGYFHSQDFLRF